MLPTPTTAKAIDFDRLQLPYRLLLRSPGRYQLPLFCLSIGLRHQYVAILNVTDSVVTGSILVAGSAVVAHSSMVQLLRV